MTVKLVKRRSTHDVHHLEPIVGIILAVSFVTIARPRRRTVVASNLPFVFALARVLRRHVPVRRASPPTRPSPSRPRRRHHLEIDPTLRSERARPRRRPTRQRARGFGVSSDARHRVPALGASPHDSASVASIALRSPRSASARSTESIGRRARVEATTRREKRRRRRSRTSNSPAIRAP